MMATASSGTFYLPLQFLSFSFFFFFWTNTKCLFECVGKGGRRLAVVLALAVGLGSWFYVAIQPEEPKLCGSEGGPPVTAPRIRLRDGRFLAYSERGVPKDVARYKIVFCHGFGSSRLDGIRPSPVSLSFFASSTIGNLFIFLTEYWISS